MDPRKWLPSLSLYRSLQCFYCGGPADTSDHVPPKCLLPRPLPVRLTVMTVPACFRCNNSFSQDELRTAAIVCTVSSADFDQIALAPGGWLHSAMQRDAALRAFLDARLDDRGMFHPDDAVVEAISRVMMKTAAGLLFHEFGQIVPLPQITLVAIEHAKNLPPSAFVESYRRTDSGWAEVTASGRELERQVIAVSGLEPPHFPHWRKYIPQFFEYIFIRRSNSKLLTGIKLHDALTVLIDCPWPSRAGPRRNGRPTNS